MKNTSDLAPDLVAVTGDMLHGYPDALKEEVAPLDRLSARFGVFGVSGNHEYYFGEKEWRTVFKSLRKLPELY